MSIQTIALIISIVAAYATIVNAYSARVNAVSSRKNIINFIQNLVLQKANECNKLWKEIERDVMNNNGIQSKSVLIVPLISEIIITFQLVDNCLKEYKYKKKRNFLLRQFWTQLNTSLRLFIQHENVGNYTETLNRQILDIKRTLQPFMS